MSEEKKEKRQKVWREFWIFLKPMQKRFIFLLLFVVLIQAGQLVSPYLTKLIIDNLTDFQTSEVKHLFMLIFLFFVSEQGVSLISFYRDRLSFRYLFDLEYYLQTLSQKKLVYLSLAYHERENTGNKIMKIDRGVQQISNLISNLTWEVVPTLAQSILTLVVLFFVDWRFSLSFLVFAPLFIFVTHFSNKTIYPIRKARFKNMEKAAGKMVQSVININTVKSFVQEEREVSEYQGISGEVRDNGIKEFLRLINHWMLRHFIVDSGRITILVLAVYLVYNNQIGIGSLVFALTLSEKAYFSLYRLSRFYDRIEEGRVAMERMLTVLQAEQDIKNKPDAYQPADIKGDIRFKSLSFSYSADKEMALRGINLHLAPGTITALVGPSGGGKTTLARMIYRHYDPDKGAVFLDGRDLRDYDLYSFRRHIAIVPQEVEIFNASVRENLTYAKPDATDIEIERAAEIANAKEFIEKLADGYDTIVGERGVKLSGGQRQRLGIARAIITDPRILIFDEATSNLDSYSEKLIQEAMDRILSGRTVVIIAHRLSTVKKADKIIVLNQGRIVEQGTHNELVAKPGGLYAKLSGLQDLGDNE
jgi:ABC-type multidrug transport system fused ATPase/permease subunit